jgi:hypothetical protein
LADAFSGRRAKRSFCVTRFWMTPIGRRWWISWMCCCARGERGNRYVGKGQARAV